MTPNVTRIYFELSRAEGGKKENNPWQIVCTSVWWVPAARGEGGKLFPTPARKTVLTLKNPLATLCLVKGYINSSFKKDKTISIQSKHIHL